MMPFDLRVAYLDSSLEAAGEVPLAPPSTQHLSLHHHIIGIRGLNCGDKHKIILLKCKVLHKQELLEDNIVHWRQPNLN